MLRRTRRGWCLCVAAALIAGCGKPPVKQTAAPSPLPTKVANVTVLGPDDKPVPGALVVVSHGGRLGDQVLKTDGQGRVKVEAAVADWRPQIAYVSFHKPGLAIGGAAVNAGEAVLRLTEAKPLSGMVRDQSGRPMAGARVLLHGVVLREWDPRVYVGVIGPLCTEFSAQTDAQGRWTIRDLPAAGTARLAVRDPRFVSDPTDVDLASVTGPVELVVRPGASLRGRVVYDTGQPAAGVAVFAQMQDDPSRPLASGGWSDAITAPDGAYQLPGLPEGTYNLMVETASKDWIAAAQEGLQVFPSARVELPDLVLTRGALVEGRVFDKSTGAPLAGAYVGSYGPHRPRSSAAIIGTETDANGWYQLRVSPGESYLYVAGVPPGYACEPPLTVSLRPGQTRTLDLRAGPERESHGWWPW